jgi:hypothetical protein
VERISTGKSYAVGKSEAKRDAGLATAFSGYNDGSSSPEFRTLGWRHQGAMRDQSGDPDRYATPDEYGNTECGWVMLIPEKV